MKSAELSATERAYFWANLAILCNAKGIPLSEVAKNANVKPSRFFYLRSSARMPPAVLITEALGMLGVSLDVLLEPRPVVKPGVTPVDFLAYLKALCAVNAVSFEEVMAVSGIRAGKSQGFPSVVQIYRACQVLGMPIAHVLDPYFSWGPEPEKTPPSQVFDAFCKLARLAPERRSGVIEAIERLSDGGAL